MPARREPWTALSRWTLTLTLGLLLAATVRVKAQSAPAPNDATPPMAPEQLAVPAPTDAPDDAGATSASDAEAGAPANAPTNEAPTPLPEPSGTPTTPPGYGDAQPHTNGAGAFVYGPPSSAGAIIPHYAPVGRPPIRPPPPEVYRNMVTVDPIAAAQGLIILSYHRALGDRVSFDLGPEVLIPGVIVDGLKGGGMIFGLGIHLLRPAPTGLWLGPRFELLFVSDGIDVGVGILAGAMAGYSRQWGHFTLSLGAGASYAHFEINGHSVLDSVIATGRTALGYAF